MAFPNLPSAAGPTETSVVIGETFWMDCDGNSHSVHHAPETLHTAPVWLPSCVS